MLRLTRWTLTTTLMVLMCLSAYAQEEPAGYDQAWIEWNTPTKRENGADLPLSEIGGYEIRYLDESLLLPYPEATGYNVHELLGSPTSGDYSVEIAVYDTKGLYSTFVPVAVLFETERPGPLLDPRQAPPPDLVELCLAAPTCRVGVLSAMRSD